MTMTMLLLMMTMMMLLLLLLMMMTMIPHHYLNEQNGIWHQIYKSPKHNDNNSA